jgi:ABC-2 type transport system ATP-binding protein
MENALTITHFTKVYRKGGVKAVDDLSLTIPRGEFFGLLGPNGAGKSTTIHCVTGISQPTAGKLEVFGRDVVADYTAARSLVGLSPQEFDVDPFEPIPSILDYVGGYHGMPKAARKARIAELLERFGLVPHAQKQFTQLSGGLKRRVILARALMHDPELLILDEPTAGVDVETRLALWDYLRELNREGKTIILTSHYLEEVEKLCGHIAIIAAGRVVKEGPKHDFVKEAGGLESAYLAATGSTKKEEN